MGFFGRLTAVTKSDYATEIAEEKCKLIDAKAAGDKEKVIKIQKRIERLKALKEKAPTKRG